MFAVRIIGILFFALAAGCAGVKQAPPGVTTQTGTAIVDSSRIEPKQDAAVATEPLRSKAKEETTVASGSPPAGPRQAVMPGDGAIGTEPVTAVPASPTPPSQSQSAAKAAAPPPAKAPTQVSASPVPIEQPRKIEDPSSVAKKQEPPLDVAALKTRLRDTNAIGVFTKLALKNQMDDLLKQFRAYHQGGQKTSVTSLRQPYDMLVLKVLSVVQDGDPSLARTISGSREAIWGILADREKFNSLT